MPDGPAFLLPLCNPPTTARLHVSLNIKFPTLAVAAPRLPSRDQERARACTPAGTPAFIPQLPEITNQTESFSFVNLQLEKGGKAPAPVKGRVVDCRKGTELRPQSQKCVSCVPQGRLDVHAVQNRPGTRQHLRLRERVLPPGRRRALYAVRPGAEGERSSVDTRFLGPVKARRRACGGSVLTA